MYAIIEVGGRQCRVEPGTRFDVPRLSSAVGAQHTVDQVLLARNGEAVQIGRPYLEGAKVVCEVHAHVLGPKTISYHFRRRENWRKTVGHRQPLTQLVVKDIVVGGAAPAPALAIGEPGTPKARTSKKARSKSDGA